MVKGGEDSTYLSLLKRFEKLTNRTKKNQPQHTKLKYLETYTLAEFEKKMGTEVIFKSAYEGYVTRYREDGRPWIWAEFTIDDKIIMATVKVKVDLSSPKDKICISYCEPEDGSELFWLIHEPYVSQKFKDKVNIDQLNDELDALLSHG